MIRRAVKVVAVLALLSVIAVMLVNAYPALIGADVSYTVMSGSMEPNIPTGSIVFVKDVPAEQIQEGDVITYADSAGVTPTTHRVVEKHQADTSVRFVTQGDANPDPDPEPVYRSEIIGIVILSIPYIGYLSAFASTQIGWMVLVVLPCSLWILSEIWELWKAGTAEQ